MQWIFSPKLLERITDFLHANRKRRIKRLIDGMHSADLADVINSLDSKDRFLFFNMISDEVAADIISELHNDSRRIILNQIKSEQLAKIIIKMDTDDAVDILEELDKQQYYLVLNNIQEKNKEKAEELQKLLQYEKKTAGGIMDTEAIAVSSEFTPQQVKEYIKNLDVDISDFHYLYVVNEDNVLLGKVSLSKMFIADDQSKVKTLMEDGVISVNVDTDQEEVAELFRKYDLMTIPVVDDENHLLGRITFDDVIDVIDEEASEDAYKMVGLETEDKVFSTPIESMKKRIFWLSINLGTAILAASVVSLFEGTINKYVLLAVFMPIVAGMGGNAGTQTLTVIIRGIALHELTFHNTKRAIFKEIAVGGLNGIVLGSISALVAYLWKGNPILGVILGMAMICNMIIAGLFGALVPITLRAIKIDPALASGVFVTTLTDISGFASFLGLATIFMKFLTN